MPVNKRSKYRGSRTCGGGTHKNRRGAGNRGGRGRAGHRDHRFSHYLLYGEIHNGKDGFSNPVPTHVSKVSVGSLDQNAARLVGEGFAVQKGDVLVLDMSQMGVDKVLGSGQVTRKMTISAKAFSAKAKEKIEAAGGQAIVK